MKPIWILAVVVAAIGAGGAGGFVATTLAKPAAEAPRITDAAPEVDHSDDLKLQAESIRQLNRRLDNEFAGLRKAMNESEAGLKAELRKQASRLDAMQQAAPEATADSTEATPKPAEIAEPTTFDVQVEAAMERIRERERAREREAMQQRMAERTEERRKQVLTRLVDTLKLTTDQQAQVDTILVQYNEKRRDLWRRGAEARENEQEFDWRGESAAIEAASKDQIRSHLLGGQLQQFNELVGEDSIDDLAGRRGMGGGAPGRNRRGGNGGNNGGN